MAETYVGLDVHEAECHATIMNEDGEILDQEEIPNDLMALKLLSNRIGDAQVAIEASYSWQPAYERLEELAHDVKVAHPCKTRIIAEAKIKSDRTDSGALAHLLQRACFQNPTFLQRRSENCGKNSGDALAWSGIVRLTT